MSTGAPPVIPDELKQYSSYDIDPQYQVKFTIVWCSAVAASILLSFPYLVRSIRNGKAFAGFFGATESQYVPLPDGAVAHPRPDRRRSRLSLSSIVSFLYWTLPGTELNAGQFFIVAAYFATIIVCIVHNAPLVENSNRAGFLAIAQFPPLFLFATKNSILSLLLGPGHGYEKLNYIHRWLGRGMFVAVVIHGSLWLRNHIHWDLAILGETKEGTGIAGLVFLCLIVFSSIRPVRRIRWEVFWVMHIIGFVAFYIAVCYHTTYAAPWIFPPLAFYGLDLLLRMLKYRIADATLVAVDSQMTKIQIPYLTNNWVAGQHIRLRIFFRGRVFESHPLTIMSAPSDMTCLGPDDQGMLLCARARGDWTKSLNEYTKQASEDLAVAGEKHTSVPIHVLVDGPYGGSSVDLGEYESVLLFAGGSGVTFTLGLLDEIVGRCVKLGRRGGERTRRIEFSWCIRSFGHIEWISTQLLQIANTAAESSSLGDNSLDLHISIYVTCLCNPEAVPQIPNCDVTITRPSIHTVLNNLLTPPTGNSPSDNESANVPNLSEKLPWIGLGGGLAVCASGPEALTREASNAVARIGFSQKLGPVGLHTELFSL